MRLLASALIAASLFSFGAQAQTKIGSVSTTFNITGPNDKVVIERFDDPRVENASCYVSHAETGGWKGFVGLAENPSQFSIACRAVGPIKIVGTLPDNETVFSERQSPMFKTMRITRFHDKDKNALVYLVWSTKLIDGSPFNAVTAIPLQ